MIGAMCLALVMLQEARGEGTLGMLAVGDVVLNRTEESGAFDICKTVAEPDQFSGWGDPDYKPTKTELHMALGLAGSLIDGAWRGVAKGATYYHATYVSPSWSKHMVRVARIGAHVFYKESGDATGQVTASHARGVPLRVGAVAVLFQPSETDRGREGGR